MTGFDPRTIWEVTAQLSHKHCPEPKVLSPEMKRRPDQAEAYLVS